MTAAEGEAPGRAPSVVVFAGDPVGGAVDCFVSVSPVCSVGDEERWGHHDGDADVRVLALPAEARSRRGELKRRGRRNVGRRNVVAAS